MSTEPGQLQYFLLGGMHDRFPYLNVGLGLILASVGIKMILVGEPFEVHMPTAISLSFIALVLAAAVGASIWADAREQSPPTTPPRD